MRLIPIIALALLSCVVSPAFSQTPLEVDSFLHVAAIHERAKSVADFAPSRFQVEMPLYASCVYFAPRTLRFAPGPYRAWELGDPLAELSKSLSKHVLAPVPISLDEPLGMLRLESMRAVLGQTWVY